MENFNTDGDQNFAKFIETDKFVKFLLKIIDCLFENNDQNHEVSQKIKNNINEKSNLEIIERFIQDNQTSTLVIQKLNFKDEDSDASMENFSNIAFLFSNEVHYTNSKSASIVLVKKDKVLEADKKIAHQIRIINLNDDSPYETLRAYVGEAVAPYFKSYLHHSDTIDRESDKLAPQVEKKIAELEMGLLHLQQNIEIPDIQLVAHPFVKTILDGCQVQGRKPKIEDFGDKINDSAFLNSLQNQVNKWIREIQKVTKLEKDPNTGSALQEITFWLNMEHALFKIQEKRDSTEVNLSLDILKQGKRFHATVSFDTDTGLKQAIELVTNYNLLMRDFPINELLAAQSLEAITDAITQIFNHAKKVRSTRYPVNRTLRLLEALSRDLNNQIKKVLSYRTNLLQMTFEEFEKVMQSVRNIFSTWDDHYENLLSLIREMNKKKGDPIKLIMRVNLTHKKLAHRMIILEKFRTQHEQLKNILSTVLLQRVIVSQTEVPSARSVDQNITSSSNNTNSSRVSEISDNTTLKEINAAYEEVCKSITEPLQVSKEADETWDYAMKRYDERIDRVEARITAQLRDQLGCAKNANEMFRIFSRYNALFIRPRIRGAIREYQTQLIQHVKRDIERLKEKFKVPYHQTRECLMSEVIDIPPVSSHIIWIRQIERRLDMYTKRIEDILGKDWETHVEGRQLKSESEAFRIKLLDSDSLFEEWAAKVQTRNYTISGHIFNVEMVREFVNKRLDELSENSRIGTGSFILDRSDIAENYSGHGQDDQDFSDGDTSLVFRYKIRVNFLPEIITLAKEVKSLKSLGYRISVSIMTNANKASQAYPLAISLMENVRAYEQTCFRLTGDPNLEMLSAKLRKDVQNKISDGINFQWDSYKLETYVPQFSDLIFYFQEKIDELTDLYDEINLELGALETCAFNYQSFTEIIDAIQRAVDNLSLKQFSNLPFYITRLDGDIRKRLKHRLREGIKSWTNKLANSINATHPNQDTSTNRASGNSNKLKDSDNYDTEVVDEKSKDNAQLDTVKGVKKFGSGNRKPKIPPHISQGSKSPPGGDPKIFPLIHEFRISNQVIYLNPPIEEAREKLLELFFSWIGNILSLTRITSSRYDLSKTFNTAAPANASNISITSRLPNYNAKIDSSNVDFSTTFNNYDKPNYQDLIASLEDETPHVLEERQQQQLKIQENEDSAKGILESSNSSILSQRPVGTLEQCYDIQSKLMDQVNKYVDQWFCYQSLWDLQPDKLYAKLGEDIATWVACLVDIRKTRETFDTTDTCRKFGPVVIEFGKVQAKVSLKYDSWHKEVLNKFGILLSQEMKSFYATISKGRVELEQKNLDGATTTSQAVSLVTYVQTLKSRLKVWEKRVNEEFKEGQMVLEKHRFVLPNDWLHIEQVEGEWNAFHQILDRKNAIIQNQVSHLQEKIISEDQAVTKRCEENLREWETSKPIEGSTSPDTALKIISRMELRFNDLINEKYNILSAKEALGIVENDISSISSRDNTKFALEELHDLKNVWIELKKIWAELDSLKETPWSNVQPRKIRQSLDGLLSTLKSLPTNLRQYSAYDFVKKLIQSYSRANVLIVELKSDAIKDRHWKRLAKKFQHSCRSVGLGDKSLTASVNAENFAPLKTKFITSSPFESILTYGSLGNELNLGHVWDLDLLKNEKEIKDVILIAQGEMALEQFLIQVRETWQNYELDMINYQNKCRIIRGWDDLFNKLKEHINSLAAMKLSPYFKEFEEEALMWEDKLIRINALFDVWVDVQRKWIYLETIFTGSNDIKNLLPNETSRFQSISTEFSNLLKRVAKSPLVLDVLNIPGVQRSLERLSEFLCKIQKALGEYLERKRTSFPRFYFIGDEDLLEIIGNGKNIPKLQKHFKKMFAGLSSIFYEEPIDSNAKLLSSSSMIASTIATNTDMASSMTSNYSTLPTDSTEQRESVKNTVITGFCSKEGEQVILTRPIILDENALGKVNEWFCQLENEMKNTLANLLYQSLTYLTSSHGKEQFNFYSNERADETESVAASLTGIEGQTSLFVEWIDKFQAQIVILSLQILWTEKMENVLTSNNKTSHSAQELNKVLKSIESTLSRLADFVLINQPLLRRKKMENMITELVHQRDMTRELINYNVTSIHSFDWLKMMRFYFNVPHCTDASSLIQEDKGLTRGDDITDALRIKMSTAKFKYGWEYMGIQEKLVQTPLTDQCFLAMTQALEARLGGSPFGPAGTGKTESVKALGHILGRFVLVFNCDETFDFQAMGRIFVGLCQVGAWGCFDEFNRLEERILSAISQQIQTIQMALREYISSPAQPLKGVKNGTNQHNLDERNVIELVGKSVTLDPNMAIFITMNPGYAGRSNLPDNLKKLFRSLAMTKPDVHLISQVLLYSQGFKEAELLAKKVVPLFKLCAEQLSNQRHYDFGLRALKSVLTSAGNIKRERFKAIQSATGISPTNLNENGPENLSEKEIIIQSICETVIPKLVSEDIPLLYDLLADVFPGVVYDPLKTSDLKTEIIKVCQDNFLVYDENRSSNKPLAKLEYQGEELLGDCSEAAYVGRSWSDKIIQLYHLTQIHHGIMLVGPSGSGKTTCWRTLFAALERLNHKHKTGKNVQEESVSTDLPYFEEDGRFHVIDPKAVSKEALYGTLDPNTREWTDGLFTSILRRIIDNTRGEGNRRQWIVFDGDVDPDWVENLNSVLDDNKLLTLPNGERLNIPAHVRILFEVQDLKYATMATVSRCGMIWFSERVLSHEIICENYLERLKNIPLMGGGGSQVGQTFTADASSMFASTLNFQNRASSISAPSESGMGESLISNFAMNRKYSDEIPKYLTYQMNETELSDVSMQVQTQVCKILAIYFAPNGLVMKSLNFAKTRIEHIMDFTRLRALNSLFSLLNQGIRNVINYQINHLDFPMTPDSLERYVQCYLVFAIIWSFSGDSKLKSKEEIGDYIQSITTIPLPPSKPNLSIVDYELTILGEWVEWSRKVPTIDIETHRISEADFVVPTIDTARHENLLYTWLADHKPMILCGPPGSGKTMTLFNALRTLGNDMEVVGLNFSSATTPELLLKTLDHYCEYRKTPNGLTLAPIQLHKWLILFCDEINLPDMDKYGTQRIISFLRQILEHGGFYKTNPPGEQVWVKVERIQFVGACNPPTDPGRKPLSHRLLRHVPVIYVDYPGPPSLYQIYHTFNRAMLKLFPNLRSYAEPLTNAMVEFYLTAQDNFTQDQQPHYIFSPRELTRWVRGIYEAIKPLELFDLDALVRLWAHEALRLFQDRLVHASEREWTDETLDIVAFKHFPTASREALKRPILYSNWMNKNYLPVSIEELRSYTKARLKVFYEEELDVQLVLFDDILDHVLRIDRVFRQPQGHVLLIGISGSGKTTISRFVAWVNGLTIAQIKVHNKYTAENFDDDLRNILKRAGCKGEKIAFIMDESNVLDSSFLERINTLLANGEVPGLFEGELYTSLMAQCKEGSQREGLMLDTNEELYKWFTNQVMRNLHVVFTMNPSFQGLKERSATSPALFNRCVINWYGDWSRQTLFQVGRELTLKLDLDYSEYQSPPDMPVVVTSITTSATSLTSTGNNTFGTNKSDKLSSQFNANNNYGDSIGVDEYSALSGDLSYRDALANGFVYVHLTLLEYNRRYDTSAFAVGTSETANSIPSETSNPRIFITPRHFLDFITHYVKLYHEKRSELEEEQLHLNVGLHKIRDTVEKVEELQKSLALKSQELEAKNALANAKLKEMIKDQQEAEMKKTTSQDIQAQLLEQEKMIQEKKIQAMTELAEVEPAVIDAQQAVKSIKKQPLVEVRSMANPPTGVKMAMESICLLLGENYSDWKAIRSVIMKDNFIPMILNFNTDDISESTRVKFMTNYLNNPDYNYEKISRASQACGPLVKWAIAQIKYADMLQKVEPLRNELRNLERYAEENRLKVRKMEETISTLEKSIGNYKEEYAVLISQAQSIKQDLEAVQTKVTRSVSLLDNLSSERVRWEQGTKAFRDRLATLPGDILLTAAFLAYAGYYDQSTRKCFLNRWSNYLSKSGIKYRSEIFGTSIKSSVATSGSFAEYLCNPEDRARWLTSTNNANNALNNSDENTNKFSAMDDLYLENVVMIKRCIVGNSISCSGGNGGTRYPLIIDPSGRAIDFIANEYSMGKNLSNSMPGTPQSLTNERKITKTSFMDDAFRKNLESALRFGNPLIVQDVENYDPILNPVLNREIRKTGGRVLITLGDQDIDLSPSFAIFMTTRDPTAEFSPDLCSKVTLINFTLTKSSLESQCLNLILKAERPDIDAKRSDLYKIQGEFKLRLRYLEQNLLRVLNETKGKSILEDDSVIATLENLKLEACEITSKMEQTQTVLADIESVSSLYSPFANAGSTIYFALENMSKITGLYQFSLPFFMNIIHTVLYENPKLTVIKEPERRLVVIVDSLFRQIYERVSRSLLHEDRLVFGIMLARIYINTFPTNHESNFDEEFDYLLNNSRASTGMVMDSDIAQMINLNLIPSARAESFNRLIATFKTFSNLPNQLLTNRDSEEYLDAITWISGKNKHERHSDDSLCIPEILLASPPQMESADKSLAKTQLGSMMQELLLVATFYPEYTSQYYHKLLDAVFGQGFDQLADVELNLAQIITKETNSRTHIMFCSVPGFDASTRIDDLSLALNKPLTSIAIGSNEGFINADKAINQFSKTGCWVVLKNVHLAPHWLVQLEKKLHIMANPHPDFRLFMTMEINPKIPVTLLRTGEVLVFEPPPGLRANLTRTYNNFIVNDGAVMKGKLNKPLERSRVHFLLAWFHALVTERLLYTPLGWSKFYDFNEADLRCAFHTCDIWIDSVALASSATAATTVANNANFSSEYNKINGTSSYRNNIDPNKIPWKAISNLLGKCDYGAKVDNDFDKLLMYAYLKKIFDSKSFEEHHALIDRSTLFADHQTNDSNLKFVIPEEIVTSEQFYDWIINSNYFPSRTDPTWLGLPHNAETLIRIKKGNEINRKLSELITLLHPSQNYVGKEVERSTQSNTCTRLSEESVKEQTLTSIPRVSNKLHGDIVIWLEMLSKIKNENSVIPDTVFLKNPLIQFLKREIKFGWQLLSDIIKNLTDISAVFLGQKKLTNDLRTLIAMLSLGKVPGSWFRYKTYAPLSEVTIYPWLTDYVKRMQKLEVYSHSTKSLNITKDDKNLNFEKHWWLGGLFNPEAFITATRQLSARQKVLSLEDLTMEITICENLIENRESIGDINFPITGMKLYGAKCTENILELSSKIYYEIPLALFRWVKSDGKELKLDIESLNHQNDMYIVKLPVYLNQFRSDVLFDLKMKTKVPENEPNLFYERGVAFTCI